MFYIDEDKTIHLTRGDIANIVVTAMLQDETPYTFTPGDVIRIQVFSKTDYSDIKIRKDVEVIEETSSATISLTKDDTKIGDITHKIVDYSYEIELNPDTKPQTIIGHDAKGAKIFRVYPEGSDA